MREIKQEGVTLLSTGKAVFLSRLSRRDFIRGCTAVALASSTAAVCAETANPSDLMRPTLYVVPYAHLDTQWHWEFPQVISEYLLKTFRVNFHYFSKYPHYIFNWTDANPYQNGIWIGRCAATAFQDLLHGGRPEG